VGRGSEEKRVHLIGKIATQSSKRNLPAEFSFLGNCIRAVRREDRSNCRFRGLIADQETMARAYAEADILLLTSSREGFPLVVMEAMSYGVVPVCTDVGGISFHVRDGENGMLIRSTDEDSIVEESVRCVATLCSDRTMLRRLSIAAYEHAREHFGGEGFCSAYRSVILGTRDTGGYPGDEG